jgi:hypothetical protein
MQGPATEIESLHTVVEAEEGLVAAPKYVGQKLALGYAADHEGLPTRW